MDLLLSGQKNRAIGIKSNKIIDIDILAAVEMQHSIDAKLYRDYKLIS